MVAYGWTIAMITNVFTGLAARNFLLFCPFLEMQTYFSPNDDFQKSAASLFVILNVSPANDPFGKIAFSSLSM
jgi:hypothetical protein